MVPFFSDTPVSTAEAPLVPFSDTPISTAEAAQCAANAAHKASFRISDKSRVFNKNKEKALARFSRHEIARGALLGEGGFGSVYEIVAFDLTDNDEGNSDDDNIESRCIHDRSRRFLKEHCLREKTARGRHTGDARYAIKYLKPKVMQDWRRFKAGAADLTTEAKILSSIEHPHIIKIRGVAAEGTSGFASGLEGGYFFIMDRLYETLEDRILMWRKQEDALEKGLRFRMIKKNARRTERLADRLKVAFDISGALKYLHGRNIIYRDLKPENIGFDVRGDVKIFDFGLAKEIDTSKVMEDDTYKMSTDTGSRRYMAPEVALGLPYNLSADVFSFGTMLWEMAALRQPYKGMSRTKHFIHVIHGNRRPRIEQSWPGPLRCLINLSWCRDLHQRPTIDQTHAVLRKLVADLRGVDEKGLIKEHNLRRSTYVLLPTAPLKQLAQ